MPVRSHDLANFAKRVGAVTSIEIVDTQGSSPRDKGAVMLVSAMETLGTIGGGQLEFMAIDQARRLLRAGGRQQARDIPLGPEIGQCCGGRVQLLIQRLNADMLQKLVREAERLESKAKPVLIFGAGHTGRALASALAALPFRTTLVDIRPHTLEGLPEGITSKVAALPEVLVRAAEPGTAFVVLTHDHAQDFLITREVLMRGDAAYAGMIGSASKRAQFRRWFLEEGGTSNQFQALICPIGGKTGDKRPEVIAALVVAEIITKIGHVGEDMAAGVENGATEGT